MIIKRIIKVSFKQVYFKALDNKNIHVKQIEHFLIKDNNFNTELASDWSLQIT